MDAKSLRAAADSTLKWQIQEVEGQLSELRQELVMRAGRDSEANETIRIQAQALIKEKQKIESLEQQVASLENLNPNAPACQIHLHASRDEQVASLENLNPNAPACQIHLHASEPRDGQVASLLEQVRISQEGLETARGESGNREAALREVSQARDKAIGN